eukprot:9312993-Pyramimonas_sp.AAC.1
MRRTFAGFPAVCPASASGAFGCRRELERARKKELRWRCVVRTTITTVAHCWAPPPPQPPYHPQ